MKKLGLVPLFLLTQFLLLAMTPAEFALTCSAEEMQEAIAEGLDPNINLDYSSINTGLNGRAFSINGIPIYHTDEFEARMQTDRVNIGVLTVPISIAQEITDKMVAGGIKAVWNFTPFRIRVPEHIVVQNTSLYAHLAVMFNRLNEMK